MPKVSDIVDMADFARELAGAWERINTANSPLGGADQEPDFSLSFAERSARAKVGLRHAQQVLGQPQWSNSQFAGQRLHPQDPAMRLKYPDGVPFSYEGFPRFGQWATHSVDLPRGFGPTREADFAKANAAAGLSSTPDGMTWHHVENGKTMQLVPKDLHAAVGHWGGVAITKALGRWDLRRQEQQRTQQPSAGRGPASVQEAARALGTGHTSSRGQQRTDGGQSEQRSRPAQQRSTSERTPDAHPGATPRPRR